MRARERPVVRRGFTTSLTSWKAARYLALVDALEQATVRQHGRAVVAELDRDAVRAAVLRMELAHVRQEQDDFADDDVDECGIYHTHPTLPSRPCAGRPDDDERQRVADSHTFAQRLRTLTNDPLARMFPPYPSSLVRYYDATPDLPPRALRQSEADFVALFESAAQTYGADFDMLVRERAATRAFLREETTRRLGRLQPVPDSWPSAARALVLAGGPAAARRPPRLAAYNEHMLDLLVRGLPVDDVPKVGGVLAACLPHDVWVAAVRTSKAFARVLAHRWRDPRAVVHLRTGGLLAPQLLTLGAGAPATGTLVVPWQQSQCVVVAGHGTPLTRLGLAYVAAIPDEIRRLDLRGRLGRQVWHALRDRARPFLDVDHLHVPDVWHGEDVHHRLQQQFTVNVRHLRVPFLHDDEWRWIARARSLRTLAIAEGCDNHACLDEDFVKVRDRRAFHDMRRVDVPAAFVTGGMLHVLNSLCAGEHAHLHVHGVHDEELADARGVLAVHWLHLHGTPTTRSDMNHVNTKLLQGVQATVPVGDDLVDDVACELVRRWPAAPHMVLFVRTLGQFACAPRTSWPAIRTPTRALTLHLAFPMRPAQWRTSAAGDAVALLLAHGPAESVVVRWKETTHPTAETASLHVAHVRAALADGMRPARTHVRFGYHPSSQLAVVRVWDGKLRWRAAPTVDDPQQWHE